MIKSAPLLARIDLTPVLGVFLPLLAVMMIAVPPAQPQVELAQSPSFYEGDGGKRVFINIVDRNDIQIGQVHTDLTTLDDNLATALRETGQTDGYIQVRAAPDVTYDDFMRVAEHVEHAGYKVGLINEDFE